MANLRKDFSKIYDQHIDKIYRFIFFKVDSQETAEDLTSETFMRTWNKFNQNGENPIDNPKAFLYKTARNLVIDYYRQKGKNPVISAELKPVVDPRQNLEEKAILSSDINMVRKFLGEINEDYQNAIIWYYLDDLPVSDVADLLGRTEDATRVLLHRAIKALKAEIDKRDVKEV